MFSPPAISGATKLGADKPLPWDRRHSLHEEKLRKTLTRRYAVYVGTYQRDRVYEALKKAFRPDEADSFKERPSGSSALLGFTVSDKGTLVEGSVVLSACAWATARAVKLGPDSPGWLDGFSELEADFATQLEETYLGEEGGGRKPVVLGWDDLKDCLDAALDALGIGDALSDNDGIRVRSEVVAQSTADRVEHDFVNSFIADDLGRVAAAAGRKHLDSALGDYLLPSAEIDAGARIDVRTQLDEVRRATDPDRIPLGRWPAGPDRPLALGQQLAVNEAVAMPRADERLFAVNGPPGTGKTTMLRDLIAALVTERAEHLAKLADPHDAFVDEPHHWETTTGYHCKINRLRPELTGFELVVASSNNGAVENITLEIPSGAAIDAPWREAAQEVDYFPMLAERAMNAGQRSGGSSPPEEQPAWALVAARLGKSRNRKDFVNSVWWPEDEDKKKDDDGPPLPGLRDLLKEWEKHPEGVSWAKAVEAFKGARDRAEAIRAERLRTRAALDRLAELEPQLEATREAERLAHDRVTASRPRHDQLTRAQPTHEAERQRRIEAREEAERRRPCFLRFRARSAWRERVQQIAAEIADLDARLDEIGAELRALEAEVRVDEEAAAALEVVERAVEEQGQILARYREKPGARLPDAEWFQERELRELEAPWTDEEWNEARTGVFLAALYLHRAFLVHAARPMRQNLDTAMDIVAGKTPAGLSCEALLDAWRALFLLVPAVSTTFASVARLFGPLGPESLGWLLVDEAGQATPQNAVGALWRCRRAVIVGDPLQLEPITSIPSPLEQAIRNHYRVDEEWLTGRGSVQSLADRLNRLGTSLPGSGRPVWVGAPLSVHRRCDQPMFELSNGIAYDGLMINATDPALGPEFESRYPTLPPSCWIDVPSSNSVGHWIPDEGKEVDRILAQLKAVEFDLTEVMAIGPFRDVAKRLRERIGDPAELRAGTIHTAQGREADVVILVLGSNPARHFARVWAASKPNLVNVAVSRARRRLYVIGDREAWRGYPYFKLLAERLPHEPPQA